MTDEILEPEPVSRETALALRPVDTLALQAKRAEGERSLAGLQLLPCETPEQEQCFADFLTMVRGIIDALEADRKSRTDPLHKEKTRIDQLYKPARDPWEKAEKLIRSRLQSAAQRRLDTEREARKLAADAAKQGDVTTAVAALATVPERPLVSGVAHTEEWDAETIDLSAVPHEFLMVDAAKVAAYCKQHQHSPTIPAVPGLRFFRKAKVRAR